MPQGYISQVQAAKTWAQAGKRLCTTAEFAQACRGDDPSRYSTGFRCCVNVR